MKKTNRAIAGVIAALMVMGMAVSGSSLYAFADEQTGQSVETQDYVNEDSGHPSQPGEVTVSKTAKAVEGMVNAWDITLRVEAMDSTSTSDIVLVIDKSDSMRGT